MMYSPEFTFLLVPALPTALTTPRCDVLVFLPLVYGDALCCQVSYGSLIERSEIRLVGGLGCSGLIASIWKPLSCVASWSLLQLNIS
jgi:hypothetical protein